MTEHKITIRTNPPFRPLRAIFLAFTQITVIGIGIITKSSAMQWAGFAVLVAMAFALAAKNRTDGLTPSEAKPKIDQIAAEDV